MSSCSMKDLSKSKRNSSSLTGSQSPDPQIQQTGLAVKRSLPTQVSSAGFIVRSCFLGRSNNGSGRLIGGVAGARASAVDQCVELRGHVVPAMRAQDSRKIERGSAKPILARAPQQ